MSESSKLRTQAHAEQIIFKSSGELDPYLAVLVELASTGDIEDCDLALELMTDLGRQASSANGIIKTIPERIRDDGSFEYESMLLSHAYCSLLVAGQSAPMVSFARRKLVSEDHTDRLLGLCLLAEVLNAEGVSELLQLAKSDEYLDVKEMAGKMLAAMD